MSAIQIVTLRPEEWQAYRQLRLEALAADPQAFSARYEDMLHRPDSFWQNRLADAWASENNWMLFARENDRLVGMIGAFTTESPDVVEIVAVYVSPEKRGLGIGSLLMDAILTEVGKNGRFQKAVLGVNSVQTAAVELYRRFGFEVVREEIVTLDDGEVRHGIFMKKDMNGDKGWG